jgi:hypothetical protein
MNGLSTKGPSGSILYDRGTGIRSQMQEPSPGDADRLAELGFTTQMFDRLQDMTSPFATNGQAHQTF